MKEERSATERSRRDIVHRLRCHTCRPSGTMYELTAAWVVDLVKFNCTAEHVKA